MLHKNGNLTKFAIIIENHYELRFKQSKKSCAVGNLGDVAEECRAKGSGC